jgi:hypothetical protein
MMDITIHLNDRPYRICDLGEGDCYIVVCFAPTVADLSEIYSVKYAHAPRLLVVDTSTYWRTSICNMEESDLDILASDVHLLADIYWLDEVHVDLDDEDNYLLTRLKAELQSRMTQHPDNIGKETVGIN